MLPHQWHFLLLVRIEGTVNARDSLFPFCLTFIRGGKGSTWTGAEEAHSRSHFWMQLKICTYWTNTGIPWSPPSFLGYLLMVPSLPNLKIDRNDVNSRALLRIYPVPVPMLRVLPPSCFLLIITPWNRYISVILNMEKWRHKEMKQWPHH